MKNENHKIKIMVLGSTGMLGSCVAKYFKQQGFNVLESKRGIEQEFVFADDDSKYIRFFPTVQYSDEIEFLFETLETLNYVPNYVFNCIGIIKPFSEKDIKETLYLNGCLPHLLADEFEKIGSKFITINSDCCWSGLNGPYLEDSAQDPLDIYGKSKSLGMPSNCMNIRTSIIGHEISENKVSLLEWFLDQPKNQVLNGFSHKWNGVTCLQVAKIYEKIIKENMYCVGTFNVHGEDITKIDMLREFKNVYERQDIVIVPTESKMIDRRLRTNYPEFLTKLSIPNFSTMVKEMKEFNE